MTVQITIIGLGQIGSSIGLAIKAGKLNAHLVGHDKEPGVAKEAQKAGAVDDVKYNLPASIRDAKLVILAIPLSGIRETLEIIAPDLQDGTVVLDTAPSKATVAAWAQELLPDGRYYIGLSPAINPDYLHGVDYGVGSARADLFKNGLFLLNANPGTPGEAVSLATDLIGLLGAQALISDSVEADGLLAYTHILPQLASAVLLDATVNQPGWLDARKLAARPYASATAALGAHEEVNSLSEMTLGNRESILRVIDTLMVSLHQLRDAIHDGDDKALNEFLAGSLKAREQWMQDRIRADWSKNEKAEDATGKVESFGERLNHMFLGRFGERSGKRNK
jgi:prephenate dehydrogenase